METSNKPTVFTEKKQQFNDFNNNEFFKLEIADVYVTLLPS